MSDVCRNTVKFAFAWLATVVAAVSCAQSGETALGQVEIAGRQVPLVAPTKVGAFQTSRTISLPDGRKVAWISPKILSEPFSVAGGWSELQAWPKLNLAGARKIHIKVVLANSALTLFAGQQIRADRTGFTGTEIAEIDKALAQLKALLEVAGNGKVAVEYTISNDSASIIQLLDAEGKLTLDTLGKGDAVWPTVNRSTFATDDGSYWGPFACTVLIHTGVGETQSSFRDGHPFAIVPYHHASLGGASLPLAGTLVQALGGSVDARVNGFLRNVVTQPESGSPLSFPSYGVSEHHLNDLTGMAVEPTLVDWVKSKVPDAKPIDLNGTTFFAYNSAKGPNIYEQLGLDNPLPFQFSAPGSSEMALGYGDLKVDILEDTEGKRRRITVPKASYTRGAAYLALDDTSVAAADGVSLTFRLRTKSKEPLTVTFGDDSWTLCLPRAGFSRTNPVVQMAFDGTWETVSLPLRKPTPGTTTLRLGFADTSRVEQTEGTIEVEGAKLVADATKAVKPSPWVDPYAEYRAKTELSGEDIKKLTADMTGSDAVLAAQAVWVFTQVKAPAMVPSLLAQAEGADAAVVYAACKALHFQGTDESFAAIKTVLDFGPFEINRRLAVAAMGDDVAKLNLKDIQSLIVSRSWVGRLLGLQILAKLDVPNKPIQVITMLQDEDPRVRAAVVEAADANNELSAKRLLYGAVNDPSEQVRTRSFLKLIDTQVEAVRREALASVRNEAVTVALSVLEAMAQKPKPEYRAALLQAVVDPRPAVRAAAVTALTAQDKAISTAEVQNLLADNDPGVQLALVRAAAAKKFALPADLLGKFKTSPDYLVAREAGALGG